MKNGTESIWNRRGFSTVEGAGEGGGGGYVLFLFRVTIIMSARHI